MLSMNILLSTWCAVGTWESKHNCMDYMKEFSIKESLIFGWQKTREHVWLLLGSLLILFIASVMLSSLGEALPIIGSLIYLVVQTILYTGFLKIQLNIVDGRPARFSDLYTTYRPFWRYLVLSILFGLIVFVGFVLLIIPGLILAASLQFGMYLVVDKQMGPIEALQRSWSISSGLRLKLLGFEIVFLLINLVGMLLLGVGLLVTVPVTALALAYIYRKLEGATPITARDTVSLHA